MPSSMLQARIAAFESGQPLRHPDSPPSPTTAALAKIPVIPPTPRAGSPAASAISPTPTVRVKPPPLPPRKPSLASLKLVAPAESSKPAPALPLPTRSASDTLSVQHTYPPTKKGKHAHAPSTSSFHSVSLSSDGGEQDDKDQDSLDGSFESVPSSIPTSTSIPSSPASDSISLNSLSSKPPVLPPRPSARTSTASLNSLPPASSPALLPSPPPKPAHNHSGSRRPAPPPPVKSPSIREQRPATAYPPMHPQNAHSASSATKRPTPIPSAARARYDALFNRNLEQQSAAAQSKAHSQALRPPRRADGWRGLSIDWTGDAENLSGAAPGEERLRRSVVKKIWSWSSLPQATLKQIWTDVDSEQCDGLTRHAFARGMWKIDEELARAASRKSARSPHRATKPGSIPRKLPPPLPSRNILS